MEEVTVSPLAQWENFYVIVGSSAGALTGLQFVVIALLAEVQTASNMLEVRAFGTPTVVHFCAALLISAIVSAPWHALSGAGICLAGSGIAGILYAAMVIRHVIRHTRRRSGYMPDAQDVLWYVALPMVGYAILTGAAVRLALHPTSALFVIAASTLLLLFIGIHNAWDSVTYIAVEHRRAPSHDTGAPDGDRKS